MFVSELMTTDVAFVSANDSVNKAFQVLYEHSHSQLPVVENGKLAGLITEKLLAEVSPSKATSLSVFEINYLLNKTKVKDIMKADIFTISPHALVEDAALVMYSNDIGSLPVITDDKTLVGILTRLDIFKAFIEIMGVNDKGARIALEVDDGVGVIAKIAQTLSDSGISINHISDFRRNGMIEIVIRVNTTDVENCLKAFEEMGYRIRHTKVTP